MCILVTGGAGYIGSHTCKELALQGYTPITYDNLSSGHKDLVRWGDFIHGDILDTQRLRECIKKYKIESIIHFAAKAYVGESVIKPDKYFKNNVSGTLSILEAMRSEEVSTIVVSSTCAVYGTPKKMPITEDTPTNPINPYGASKLFMERMLADYEKAYNLKWMALRYFNAAGCDPEGETREWHEPETHLIPRMLMAAAGIIPALEIYGNDYPTPDGTCIRDYIHVKDLAEAHIKALNFLKQKEQSQPLNLGTGQGFSIQEILQSSKKIIGRSVPHTISSRREGDPARLVADSQKAFKILGWEPIYSDIETILKTAWKGQHLM